MQVSEYTQKPICAVTEKGDLEGIRIFKNSWDSDMLPSSYMSGDDERLTQIELRLNLTFHCLIST